VTRLLPFALLGALSVGCVSNVPTGAFSYQFPDNVGEDLAPVLAAQPPPSDDTITNAIGEPLAAVTTHPIEPEEGSDQPATEAELAVLNLTSGEVLWRKPFEAMTRPQILGDVVMTSVRGAVVALDLRSGEELWREELDDLAYVGASRSGNVLVWVASVGVAGGANRKGRLVAMDARSGRTRWEHAIDGVLGHPQLRGGYVFVPWDRQNIAILGLQDGIEVARLRTTDDVIGWVRAEPQGVYYGYRGIYKLNERSASGTKEGSTYREAPLADAPREPLVQDDGYYPTPGTRSARGRIRVYYEPEPTTETEGIPVEGDRFYFVYFRYVFAFDGDENLRWARVLPRDIVRAHALHNGVLTIAEDGNARLLGHDEGDTLWERDFDLELASAGLDVGDFAPQPNVDADPAETERTVRTALTRIAGDPDNRLVPARAFAVELLAKMDEPEITRDLLDLYAQRSTPGALREAIGNALRVREVGTEYLVAALDQHYDYLDDVPAPPLGLIVPALLEQRVDGAVEGLVAHMMDHETPAEVLPTVIRGVVELGDESIVPALRTFLTLYHADSLFEDNADALAVAAEGVFRHGGDEGRALLQALMAQPRTEEPAQAAIQGLFDREQADAAARAQAEAEAAERAAARAAAAEAAARPTKLSQAQINEVFVAHTEHLRGCIEGELERNPRLGMVRFAFIINNDGSTQEMRYAPQSEPLVECLRPVVEELRFPQFQQRRQRASFTVSLRGGDEADQSQDEVVMGPWWQRAQRRSEAEGGERNIGRPWWEVRRASAPSGGQGDEGEGGEGGQGEGGEGEGPWWMEGQEGGGSGGAGGSGEDGSGSEGGAGGDSGGDSGGGGDSGDQPWWLPSE
jgi:hypothetical protein